MAEALTIANDGETNLKRTYASPESKPPKKKSRVEDLLKQAQFEALKPQERS